MNPENRPTQPRERAVWLSHRDVAQMVERCLGATLELGFDAFFVTSRNRLGYRDLAHARHAVGYEPEDSADDFPLE